MAKCAVGRNFQIATVEPDGSEIPEGLCDAKATDTITMKTTDAHRETAKNIFHVCKTHWKYFKEDNQYQESHGHVLTCPHCGKQHKNQTIRYTFRRGIR